MDRRNPARPAHHDDQWSSGNSDGIPGDRDFLACPFDHTDPAYSSTMFQVFDRLRSYSPVLRSELHGGFWVVSRYRDVVAVLQDHRTFGSGKGILIPSVESPVPGIPTESDEPEHSFYRRVLWPFLTPGVVKGYEPYIRTAVGELLDEVIELGEADVVAALAKPVPSLAIGQFFGFDATDALRCHAWIDTMLRAGPTAPERAIVAAGELFAFLEEAIVRAEADPRDDVISAIAVGDVDGRRFSREEQLGLLFTAISGALETTVSAIAHAVFLLDRFPDARAQLIERPALVTAAVEEVLRMASPAHSPARTATTDATVDGQEVRHGDRVLLLFASANHDESVFEDPQRFRLERRGSQHVAFGWGIHKCEGQHLARLELRIVIEELLRRIPDYRVLGEPVPRVYGPGICGIDELRISFTPGERES